MAYIVFLVFFIFADVVLVLFLLRYWRATRRNNPDFRLNFRIIDLWTASLCLGPTVYLLTVLLQQSSQNLIPTILLGALLIPYQLGGILCMFLNEDRAHVRANRSGISAFLSVVIGALAGLVGLAALIVVIALSLFTLGILLAMLPYSLMLIPLYLLRKSWRR